ncbi:unnamed protein product [Microthlaspi erraticum]|uniref:F-box domain-containing protein n=1 Tax=Microthlaspi erraticum TaxID=1685480 RepID=A0A6D2J0C7_9BRAS|nr:unnamed protein product [Microthlaspi erraticum]
MEMEERHTNPNSHKRLTRDPLVSWSDLPLDLLTLVFKRLSFPDFQRAKSVCWSWLSSSRQSVPKNSIPWLVLFPEDNNKSSSCTLFNPEETDKLYRTQDLGLEFAKRVCMATYGSWFLMRDPHYNLSIVNIFTHERINLPPVELQTGMIKIERTVDDGFRVTSPNGFGRVFKCISIRSPVFWIDEKTKDYIVLWRLLACRVFYSRKGHTSWKQIPESSDCRDMFYKDHKLYLLTFSYFFQIFDFSSGIPQLTFNCGVIGEGFHLTQGVVVATKLVVTVVTGQVLKVEKIHRMSSTTLSFRVFKIVSSGLLKKQEVVSSIGDETLLFDQGITVLANDADGFIRNSIYFSCSNGNTNDILLFNLKTQKTEPLPKFDRSSVHFSRARWFLPSFTQT